MRTFRILLLVLVPLFALASCDKHAEDKAAIRACLDQLSEAYNQRNGQRAAELVTKETLDHYGELLRLALDGKKAEIEALSHMDRYEVLLIRAKGTRKDMRGLTGRGYQAWSTKQAWWESPEFGSMSDAMARLTVDSTGQGAWSYIEHNGRATRHRMRFTKDAGTGEWRFDELSARDYWSELIENDAADARMDVETYIYFSVLDEPSRQAAAKLWEPMK